MAIRTLGGGDEGTFLYTACNVIGTLQSTIAVDDYVIISNSGNWTVTQHGDNADIALCAQVVELSDNSAIATCKWLGYNKVAHVPTSGTMTLGYYACTDSSTVENFIVSGNAAASVRLTQIVAANNPTGYADLLVR